MNYKYYLAKRSNYLLTLSIFGFLLSTVFSTIYSQDHIAKGTVFLDSNVNNQFDSQEKGLEGIKVSNGVDVVKTDAKENYKIDLPPESILFISKPT